MTSSRELLSYNAAVLHSVGQGFLFIGVLHGSVPRALNLNIQSAPQDMAFFESNAG